MKKKNKKKRVLIIADPHCGHDKGLTPPKWNITSDGKNHYIRKQFYDVYIGMVKPLKADILFINGDAIDGTGRRSGGTEEIVTDRNKQVEMAIDCIKETGVHPDNMVLTYGCLTAGHRILTKDLKWIPVEQLKVGDKLLAFDENRKDNRQRQWKESEVLANSPEEREVAEIILSDGTKLESTWNHPFLMKSGRRNYEWRTVQQLYDGSHYKNNVSNSSKGGEHNSYPPIKFKRILPLWETENSYESGYLAGFFDGEGCCSQRSKGERNG